MTIERPMFPPVDPTRRRLLTVAAAGAVAAAIPTITLSAAPAVDPLFDLIDLQTRLLSSVRHGDNIGRRWKQRRGSRRPLLRCAILRSPRLSGVNAAGGIIWKFEDLAGHGRTPIFLRDAAKL